MLFGTFFFFLLSIILILINAAPPPASYDLKALHPNCRAFLQPFDQGSCASCCAAAIATQLSLRECMSNQLVNKLYSAQQIWDCGGGSCATGVGLDSMIEAMGRGGQSSRTLYALSFMTAAPLLVDNKDPNNTQCIATAAGYGVGDNNTKDQLGGVSSYDMASYHASLEYSSLLASRAMMNEIWENGPVVSVLTMNTHADFDKFTNFTYMRDGRVFIPNPNNYLPPDTRQSHCLVVYGWGVDSVSGLKYWLVQNSYGTRWGDGGFGRIVRGKDLLEGSWRGLFPQTVPNNNDTFSSTPSSKLLLTQGYMMIRPPDSPLLPDNDIIIFTFISAIFVACLLVYILSKFHILSKLLIITPAAGGRCQQDTDKGNYDDTTTTTSFF